jgi:amidase
MVSTEISRSPAARRALWALSVRELVAGLRAREFSAEEVVEGHLARISACQPEVNALSEVWADSALSQARQADRDRRAGLTVGELSGVPFTVKANMDRRGASTTHGVLALRGAVATVDAPPVASLVAAGAIPLAQSNMPDFAFRWHTESSAHGVTVNPWDPSVTPGGSSGGAAVACASGMAPFGLGNDTGGSLRQPAQCCGVASLRPTMGRVADAAVAVPTPGLQAFTVPGVLARDIADVAVVFPHLLGLDARDPLCAPISFGTLNSVAPRFCVHSGSAPLDPAVAASLERSAAALVEAGYERVDAVPPDPCAAADLWTDIISADLRHQWRALSAVLGPPTLAFLEAFLALRTPLDVDGLLAAYTKRYALAREWSLFMREVPLVLTPVSSRQAFPVGFDVEPGSVPVLLRDFECLVAVNLLGLPAAVCGTGLADGLPQAVQIIGPRYREDVCLAAGSLIEQRCGGACDPARPPLTASIG